MKTAREWFKELPDDIEKMAVENAEKYHLADAPCKCLSDSIIMSFNWMGTPQGREFWQNVYDQHCEE